MSNFVLRTKTINNGQLKIDNGQLKIDNGQLKMDNAPFAFFARYGVPACLCCGALPGTA